MIKCKECYGTGSLRINSTLFRCFYCNGSGGVDLSAYCDDKRHLVCKPYSKENLHVMADFLKIKRCWYHAGRHPHYDIPKRRIEEIKSRCTVVTTEEILKIIKGEM
jgi:hypothetical protein